MQIKQMFEKQIDRPITGVIKVGQILEDNKEQELSEYVVTKELSKHFREFFGNYASSIHNQTDEMGVWISGFFGSGKSHFLKILSYILDNEEVDGKKAIDYFKDKDAISILFKIIDSEKNGLGIGNMTSQVLAIFYLNGFDHFVKEVLKIKKMLKIPRKFLFSYYILKIEF